jgi:hypothetical protein
VSEILKKLVEWRLFYLVGAVVLIWVNFVIDTERFPLPSFFSPAWLPNHPGWGLGFIVLAAVSCILCLYRWGFVCVVAACGLLVVPFVLTYDPKALGNTQFIAWLCYRGILALAVGVAAEVFDRIAKKLALTGP